MSSENITLITQKRLFRPADKMPHTSRGVIAIEYNDGQIASRRPDLLPHPDKPAGRVTLALGNKAAQRLIEFYRDTHANPAFDIQGSPQYDCFDFATTITDGVTRLEDWSDQYDLGSSRYENDLEQGHAYAIIDRNGVGTHAMIGGHDPRMNLAAWGENGPLIYTSNISAVGYYGGACVQEIVRADGTPLTTDQHSGL